MTSGKSAGGIHTTSSSLMAYKAFWKFAKGVGFLLVEIGPVLARADSASPARFRLSLHCSSNNGFRSLLAITSRENKCQNVVFVGWANPTHRSSEFGLNVQLEVWGRVSDTLSGYRDWVESEPTRSPETCAQFRNSWQGVVISTRSCMRKKWDRATKISKN